MTSSMVPERTDSVRISKLPNRSARAPFGILGPLNYPILYLNVPKSACTSIKCIMYYLDHGSWPEDPLTIHQLRDLVVSGPAWSDDQKRRLMSNFLFTFVRHPLKRAYSAFNEKINHVGPYSLLMPRHRLEARYGARFSEDISLEEHRRNFSLFLNFVGDMMSSRRRKNLHFAPQAHGVIYIQHHRMMDFIGRVENMDEDIKIVLNKAGYRSNLSIPRFNEGPPPPYSYNEILTDEIVTIGKRVYRDDFRLFGYEI